MAQMTKALALEAIAHIHAGRAPPLTGWEMLQLLHAWLGYDDLRAALTRIAALDPATDSKEGHNEWGEAACFAQAQMISHVAVGASWRDQQPDDLCVQDVNRE